MCLRQRFVTLQLSTGYAVEDKNMKTLEIVWRNPNMVSNHRRHSVERAGERILYRLQESVEVGALGDWMTLSYLEVLPGGQAA
jgi:hypothetical protein